MGYISTVTSYEPYRLPKLNYTMSKIRTDIALTDGIARNQNRLRCEAVIWD